MQTYGLVGRYGGLGTRDLGILQVVHSPCLTAVGTLVSAFLEHMPACHPPAFVEREKNVGYYGNKVAHNLVH